MTSFWVNFLFSIGGSIIASTLWWLLFQLVSVGARDKIVGILNNLRFCNISFENALEYNYYDIANHNVDIMISNIIEISQIKKPLTFWCRKQFLFNTFLNNLFQYLISFKAIEIGYIAEEEKVARCEKMKRRLFIFDNGIDSITKISIELLQDLCVSHRNSLIILSKSFCFNDKPSMVERKEKFKNLIEVRHFKGGNDKISKIIDKKHFLTPHIFTRTKYEKLIDKILEN